MLTLSLFILLIYSSVLNSSDNLNIKRLSNLSLLIESKNLVRIGIIIILYTLYIIYDLSLIKIEYFPIYLYNDLYVLNIFNIYIYILISIIIISLLTINTTLINNLSWINNFNKFYISIILFNLLGIILLISSNNIISIFIGIELQSYSLYILTGITNKSSSGHNSLFYYLIGGLGSIIILYGLSLIYYISGNIYLNYINIILNYNSLLLYEGWSNNLILGYIILLFGLLIKIGAAPMYNWSILLYMNSNTIITSYISIIPKISILSYIWILYNNIININTTILFNNINENILIFILSIIISLSLIIGSIGGLTQIKIKSILAYSGLLNIGYLLLSIIINNINSLIAYIIYITQYSFNHISIFLLLIISILYNKTSYNNLINNHIIYIYELINIRKNIFLVISFIIVIGSFIGIPPLFGFYGKYYLLISLINNNYIFLSLLLIICSIISTGYYLYILNIIIIKKIYKIYNNNLLFYNNYIKDYNNIYIIHNSLSYILSSYILIILFNFIQSNNILKGAYIISMYYLNVF
uniref:NADH-ubiquinone oxidoreductase chain 2 n=1 Tax=Wickerhamomyces mucosus TaxID=1378264 RepID=S5U552_9ASCO|nr:NADH dehydrogenase subunit 2 [Wickerhamomyces mucosus]AGS44503.1 NADH dehydrogenase subunit 2 [Wickerhamomyces mucosus]